MALFTLGDEKPTPTPSFSFGGNPPLRPLFTLGEEPNFALWEALRRNLDAGAAGQAGAPINAGSGPGGGAVPAAAVPLTKTEDVKLAQKKQAVPTWGLGGSTGMLEAPWREMAWTEDRKEMLMEYVSSYKPDCEAASQARVLLLGPVGAGKSSFISSVQSAILNGRVTNRAMVGSSTTCFTKKLQSFHIRGQSAEPATALSLWDVMGLGDGETTGLTLHDALSVIKGHVPEGHKFSLEQPVRSETAGYVKKPSLRDKVHCVVFVVDASKVSAYPKILSTTFRQLREHISDLGVHQVALLTHVDQVCQETARDVSQVYKSRIVQEKMIKAGDLLGMPLSYIVPVKNYSSQLDLDENTDLLLLSAVDHVLQYVDLYFQDSTPEPPKMVLSLVM